MVWRQGKSRLHTRNFVNDYDFGVKRATFVATLPQTLATFVATFAQKRTPMPATFATSPATMTATLAERRATTRSHGQHGGPATPPRAPGRRTMAASWQHTAKAAMHGGGCNATPQGHKQGVQRAQSGGNVGTADRVKAPHSGVKMANRAYSRKAPGIHREQKKTPHSLRHAGHGYFWSFARSSSSNTGCNKIYNRITGGTSLFRPPNMRRSRARSARPPSRRGRSCPRSAAGSCTVPQYRPS